MPSAVCPSCCERVTGTLEAIKLHVTNCPSKKGSREDKKRTKTVKAPRVIPSIWGEMPALPFELEVPLVIKSQNKSQYAHWSVYKKYKDAWYSTLPVLLRQIQGRMFAWSRWSFTRVYARGQRELDYGNLVGGCKPIPDALIIAGAIPDDCPKHFKAAYEQVRGERVGTIIRLEEIADAPTN